MKDLFHRSRTILVVRGAVAVLFGAAALLWPNITVSAVVLLIGAYILADGLLAAFASVRYRAASDLWWVALLEGAFGIGVGLAMMGWPQGVALSIVVLVGLWSVATGVIELLIAGLLRRDLDDEWTLITVGVASVLLGGFLLIDPQRGVMALSGIVGFYALLAGGLMLSLAARLRRLARAVDTFQDGLSRV